MGASSVAMIDKADKAQAAKTPKGLMKKKEKAGVGVLWAGGAWDNLERSSEETSR